MPHRVHTIRRQSERTGVASGSQSALHGCVVVTAPRAAIDEQIPAAVRADVPQRYRLERLPLPNDHLNCALISK